MTLFVVLVEEPPFDSRTSHWRTVLRMRFEDADAAIEAGLRDLEPVADGLPRRIVAVPLEHFQIFIADPEGGRLQLRPPVSVN